MTLILVLLLALSASGEEKPGKEPGEKPSVPSGKIRIAVSVDWEGASLREEDLRIFEVFHLLLPDVPLTHFLNPAYFTRKSADASPLAKVIRSAIRKEDEIGLHVHPYRSLTRKACVAFRDRPRFWGDQYDLLDYNGDCGIEVELCAYLEPEIRAIVRVSREILEKEGFKLSRAFRAGGWMASRSVLTAVRAEGFFVDSSSTDTSWHDEIKGYPLHERIRELWPDVDRETQPYVIRTSAGPILEMPDTCALADYVTTEEMVKHVDRAIRRLQGSPERDIFCHIGFHQENAAKYGTRILLAIHEIKDKQDSRIVFETLSRSARATGLVEWDKMEKEEARKKDEVGREKKTGPKRLTDAPGSLPRVRLKTDRGEIVLELFEDDAPNHVANFISLVLEGFYDGLVFHRVEDWIVQGGCPEGIGNGGPGYRIKAEITLRSHQRIAVGMARAWEMDSAGSQFYILKKTMTPLDGKYTIFGRVVSGMETVDRLQKGDMIMKAVVDQMRDKAYRPRVTYPGEKEERLKRKSEKPGDK
ncbi:MAG: peptidylprolyl isomerase [Planctomycetota bacterium]